MSLLRLIGKKYDIGFKLFQEDPKIPIYSKWGAPSLEQISDLLSLSKAERIEYLDQYQDHVWVYVCTFDVSEAAANVPWKLFSRKDPQKEIEKHEIIDLLNRPNSKTSNHQLKFAIFAYRQLMGNSYTYLVGNNPDSVVSQSNKPKALFVLVADRVSVKRSDIQPVDKYIYTIDGRSQPFDPIEIVHTKQFNPKDEVLGQSTIESLKSTLLEDKHAAQFQSSFFKNSLVPSGVLSTEGALSNEQRKRLKKQLEEKHVGKGRSHKPLLLEEGTKWQSIAMSPKDVEWLNKHKINRENILAAFGEPPTIAGIEGSNFAESKIYEGIFYTKTVIPMVNDVIQTFNISICPFYDDDLFFQADLSGIQALHESLEEIRTLGKDAVPGIITPNEMRKIYADTFGFDLPDLLGGDVLLYPATMIPITDLGGEAENLGET